MGNRIRVAKVPSRVSEMPASPPQLFGTIPPTDGRENTPADPPAPFDVRAWADLVEKQRQLIAKAAGVDPSKVRISIGH